MLEHRPTLIEPLKTYGFSPILSYSIASLRAFNNICSLLIAWRISEDFQNCPRNSVYQSDAYTHMGTSYKWTRVSYVDLVSGLFCVFFTGYSLGTKYCITCGIFVLRVFSWLFLFAFLVSTTASACSERLVSEVPHSVLKGTLNPTQCPA